MDIQQETDALRKVSLFSKLEPSKLKLLAFTSELFTYGDDEEVFTEGDHADCAFVIMDGEADIFAHTEAGDVVVGTLKSNQLVGELGVLTNAPRSATIRAKGKLVMLRISDEMFLKLLAENPQVALDVMRQLSGKLVLAHRQYQDLQDKMQRLNGA